MIMRRTDHAIATQQVSTAVLAQAGSPVTRGRPPSKDRLATDLSTC